MSISTSLGLHKGCLRGGQGSKNNTWVPSLLLEKGRNIDGSPVIVCRCNNCRCRCHCRCCRRRRRPVVVVLVLFVALLVPVVVVGFVVGFVVVVVVVPGGHGFLWWSLSSASPSFPWFWRYDHV